MTLTRMLRLACDGCGYRPGRVRLLRRPLYPAGNGETMCDRCAYGRGMLSGRERRRYTRRHPLRAAWLLLRRGRAKKGRGTS